jgi:hypothetical protein
VSRPSCRTSWSSSSRAPSRHRSCTTRSGPGRTGWLTSTGNSDSFTPQPRRHPWRSLDRGSSGDARPSRTCWRKDPAGARREIQRHVEDLGCSRARGRRYAQGQPSGTRRSCVEPEVYPPVFSDCVLCRAGLFAALAADRCAGRCRVPLPFNWRSASSQSSTSRPC